MKGAGVTARGCTATRFQRWFANGYDWFFDRVDARGGGEHRRRLAEGATGQVLEIGAGTGRNLPSTATPRWS